MKIQFRSITWFPILSLLAFTLSGCVGNSMMELNASTMMLTATPPSTQSVPEIPTDTQPTIAQPSAQQQLSQSKITFTIEGIVSNGSGGDLLGMPGVSLFISNYGQTLAELAGPVSADGMYSFAEVPYSPDWRYFTQVTYGGITYRSARVAGLNFSGTEIISLPIRVFDSTSDTSGLRAESLHVMLNFKNDDTIHVVESFLITNPSSNTISSKEPSSPVLNFPLQSKATGISFNNFWGTEYFKVAEGQLGDWQPILPGSVHQVMFEYDLPFEGEQSIELFTPLQVASVMVMLDSPAKQISCAGMRTSDQYPVMTQSMMVFTAENIAANGKLVLHCLNKKEVFPIVMGVGALVFALAVALMIVVDAKKRPAKSKPGNGKDPKKTTLLDAIITLDDQYKAGEISAEVYQAKREELIKKLEGE